MMASKPCWIDFYERGLFTECDCNYEKDCWECERRIYGQSINRKSHRECESKDIQA